MTQTATALYNFFSGFDIPAYAESTEPDNAPAPYITYEIAEPDWGDQVEFHAQLWYRDTSFSGVSAKVDEIGAAIDSGLRILTDEGIVTLHKANGRWAQHRPLPGDPTIKCMYLRLLIEYEYRR